MGLCEKCRYMVAAYDRLMQEHDDVVIIGDKSKPNHYCPMYDDHIPEAIYYGDGKCDFYDPKGEAERKEGDPKNGNQ